MIGIDWNLQVLTTKVVPITRLWVRGVMIENPREHPIDFRLKFIGARLCHSKKITIGKRGPPKGIYSTKLFSAISGADPVPEWTD